MYVTVKHACFCVLMPSCLIDWATINYFSSQVRTLLEMCSCRFVSWGPDSVLPGALPLPFKPIRFFLFFELWEIQIFKAWKLILIFWRNCKFTFEMCVNPVQEYKSSFSSFRICLGWRNSNLHMVTSQHGCFSSCHSLCNYHPCPSWIISGTLSSQ
jgi:hypothetical protein